MCLEYDGRKVKTDVNANLDIRLETSNDLLTTARDAGVSLDDKLKEGGNAGSNLDLGATTASQAEVEAGNDVDNDADANLNEGADVDGNADDAEDANVGLDESINCSTNNNLEVLKQGNNFRGGDTGLVASVHECIEGNSDLGVEVSGDTDEIPRAPAGFGGAATSKATGSDGVLSANGEVDIASSERGNAGNRGRGGEEAEGEDGSEDSSEAHVESRECGWVKKGA